MFKNFEILWVLWAIPVLALLFILWGARTGKARGKLASPDTSPVVLRYEPRVINTVRVVLILIACLLFFVALARPQGGLEYVDVETRGFDIVLAIDISKSMLAADFSPTRLEFLKRQAKNFVRAAKGNRFAIVAFAGDAYVHMPLTTDTNTAITFIDRLDIKSDIKQGTAIGEAINVAVDRFIGDDKNAKVIILFTDGENNKGQDPLKAARAAADQGVAIFPVGIGSLEGDYVPDYVDLMGHIHFKTDQKGRRITTKLDEKTLRKIASLTGGTYYNASDPAQLVAIYMQLDKSLIQIFSSRQVNRSEELAPMFLVAGLILLFMEAGLHYLTPAARPRKGGRYAFNR